MISPVWGGVDYPVTQPFLPGPPVVHCGIDIGCPSGTIIHAARAGVVERVQQGMVGVHVEGSQLRDFYLHGYPLVGVGQHVDAGTPVIHSDTVPVDPRYPPTGPHLHFEVQDGYSLPGAPPWAPERPLDPVPILAGLFGAGAHGGEDLLPDERSKLFEIWAVITHGTVDQPPADNPGNLWWLSQAMNNLSAAISKIQPGAGLTAAQEGLLNTIAGDVQSIRQRIEKDLAP